MNSQNVSTEHRLRPKAFDDSFLDQRLARRVQSDSVRSLTCPSGLIDFCSNDYLGLARSQELRNRIHAELSHHSDERIGATGSRLLTGNSHFVEELESRIAAFHHAECGLIFNSGYDANLGLLSAVLGPEDTLVYDEHVHASIHDGMRLGRARTYPFRHNDLDHLERRLTRASGRVFVAVESVYSMDGDFAPLGELAELCDRYGCRMIVDEAHATGLYGEHGRGRVAECGCEALTFARVHTFGKALGCHGAVVVGSEALRTHLINFARPLIYSTALPQNSLLAIKCAYDLLPHCEQAVTHLFELVEQFRAQVCRCDGVECLDSRSAIQSLILPGNQRVRRVAHTLQQAGFDVRPIMNPTVKRGRERLRICLHTFNTPAEVTSLLNTLRASL